MSSSHSLAVKYSSPKSKDIPAGSVSFDGSNGSMGSALSIVNIVMDDVSTAGSSWAVSPVAGDIIRIQSIIDGAIATADAVITPQINTVAITGGAITIATAGSAAGDIDVSTPTALRTVAVGDAIEIATSGASTNTVRANFTVTIQRSS